MDSNKQRTPFRTQLTKLHISSMKQQIVQFDIQTHQKRTPSVWKNPNEQIRWVEKGYDRKEREGSRRGVGERVEMERFDSEKSIGREWVEGEKKFVKRSSVNLKKLEKSDTFRCQGCHDLEDGCVICQNEKTMNGNSNFLKFLDFVLGFKLGSEKSYQPHQISKSSHDPINSHCIQFFQSYSLSSKNLHTSTQSYNYPHFSRKISQQKSVHSNYRCDSCGVYPIIGTRIHCSHSQCQNDTDLCESCYSKYGHEHKDSIEFIRESIQYRAHKNISSRIESELTSSQSMQMSSGVGAQKQNREYRNMLIQKSIRSAKV